MTTGFAPDALIADDIEGYLAAHEAKSLLRFITCGSVDDGKSTLIGRLLYEVHAIFDDQLSALEHDSKRVGTQGQDVDFALLVDGLAAEREQGITIDVAYRFFATAARKYIVADCPGHEQYTRNMVTGASTADLAVILIDARKGVLTQTRRHSYLAQLVGVRHIVLAVNKMDLVGYDRSVFDRILLSYRAFASEVGITRFTAIPLSGLKGDNVAARSAAMPWYSGPTLIDHLDTLALDDGGDAAAPLRLPVQWVARSNLDFRGFAGQVANGTVTPGQRVRVLPGGQVTHIAGVTVGGDPRDAAQAGESALVTLADDIDVSRGSVIAAADDPPDVADRFEATIVWMADEAMVPGRGYWLKLATQSATATIAAPKYQVNVNTLEQTAARSLDLNAIGVAEVACDRPIVFAPYRDGARINRTLGGFILIDKLTNATVAAGMLHFALRRATNVHRQPLTISRAMHAGLKNQTPAVLWFTGLSGSGKSTIADKVAQRLFRMNRHCFMLDGDNVRHGLSKDLGFTDADRIENIRRVGEVARLMTDAGLIVITAFISPFAAERDLVRAMMADGEFIEIFVDTPIAVAEARDVKGLYAKARRGALLPPRSARETSADTTRATARAADSYC